MMLNEEEFYDAVETALDKHDEEDGENDDLVNKNKLNKNFIKVSILYSCIYHRIFVVVKWWQRSKTQRNRIVSQKRYDHMSTGS